MTALFFYLLGFAGTLAWRLYLKRDMLTGFYARHKETEEIVMSMLAAVVWPVSVPVLLLIEAVRIIMHTSITKDD